MTRIDVNDTDKFMDWILSTFTLIDATNAAPEIWSELLEAFNDDWCTYCETANVQACPECGASCNDDQTIDDHGMCWDCFHNGYHQPNWSVLVQFMGRHQRIDVWISPAVEEPTMTDVLLALKAVEDLEEPFHIIDWEPYV